MAVLALFTAAALAAQEAPGDSALPMYQFDIQPEIENIKLGDKFNIVFSIKNISAGVKRFSAFSFVGKGSSLRFFYQSQDGMIPLNFCVPYTVSYKLPDNPYIILNPGDMIEWYVSIRYTNVVEQIDLRTLTKYSGAAIWYEDIFIPISSGITNITIIAELKDSDGFNLVSNRILLKPLD
jgi:hypothetical protein